MSAVRNVQVNFYASLRQAAGQKSLEYPISDNISVRELVSEIIKSVPDLEIQMIDEYGGRGRHVGVVSAIQDLGIDHMPELHVGAIVTEVYLQGIESLRHIALGGCHEVVPGRGRAQLDDALQGLAITEPAAVPKVVTLTTHGSPCLA